MSWGDLCYYRKQTNSVADKSPHYCRLKNGQGCPYGKTERVLITTLADYTAMQKT